MSGRACLVLGIVLAASSARADATNGNRFALELGGVRYGLASVSTTTNAPGPQHLVVTTQDVAPSLVGLVGTFAQGKLVKKDLRLASGAVVRKANDARLASVKLPAMGSGGAADIELAFVASALTTQPLLSAKESPPLPAAARITGFRIDVSGLNAIETPKLDAITLIQKAEGNVTTGDIAFEAGAGGALPFTSWHKAKTPRTVRIEYVGSDGKAILEIQLDRCTTISVTPRGANGTTRIALTCANVRAS